MMGTTILLSFQISKNYFIMAMADNLQYGSELAGLMIVARHRTYPAKISICPAKISICPAK